MIPLDTSPETRQQLFELVSQAINKFYEHNPSVKSEVYHSADDEPQPLSDLAITSETGRDIHDLLATIFHGAEHGQNTTQPGFMAYIPGGGLFSSCLAELISSVMNRHLAYHYTTPVLSEIQWECIKWILGLLKFPQDSRGILTSGSSIANYIALVTARMTRLPENFLDGVIYISNQTHHCVAKVALLAGFPSRSIRIIPASAPTYQLDLQLLRQAIAEDRAQGLRPFCVVATGGTTNCGAVDDIDALASLCEEESLWLHVDAAYGGFLGLMTERGQTQYQGIERADSVALDMHKSLFLPYGIGGLFVRDGAALYYAHNAFHLLQEASYIPSAARPDLDVLAHTDKELQAAVPVPPGTRPPPVYNHTDYSPELTIDFRGLRIWLPLQLHGTRAFQENLEEKFHLTDMALTRLRSLSHVRLLVPEPQMTIITWHVVPRLAGMEPAADLSMYNEISEEAMNHVNDQSHAFLSGTVLDGVFVVRLCILSYLTTREVMESCLRDIEEGVQIVVRKYAAQHGVEMEM